jgi:hypothetical protein
MRIGAFGYQEICIRIERIIRIRPLRPIRRIRVQIRSEEQLSTDMSTSVNSDYSDTSIPYTNHTNLTNESLY